MARNDPSAYGRDVQCIHDADALFTEIEGIDVVRQDAIHRLTTDDVLGDDGTGSLVIRGWGFDCRRLLGIPERDLAIYQPVLVEVLLRDERIDTADVELEATKSDSGMADVVLDVRCTTALGPFNFVRKVSELTADDLVGQVA